MSMTVDTFSEYHLREDDLLDYLKGQFPAHAHQISVTKVPGDTDYQLTIPEKLTQAQRDYIAAEVRYIPDVDD